MEEQGHKMETNLTDGKYFSEGCRSVKLDGRIQALDPNDELWQLIQLQSMYVGNSRTRQCDLYRI